MGRPGLPLEKEAYSAMTWSPEEALNQRKNALRLLLDESGGKFTRSLVWYPQLDSGIPDAVWSQLYQEGLVDGSVIGGPSWQRTYARDLNGFNSAE